METLFKGAYVRVEFGELDELNVRANKLRRVMQHDLVNDGSVAVRSAVLQRDGGYTDLPFCEAGNDDLLFAQRAILVLEGDPFVIEQMLSTK